MSGAGKDNVAEFYEDEIDLIELIRGLWEKKHIIIIGVFLLGLFFSGIYLLKGKEYRVETIISPGVVDVSNDGKQTLVETPQNVKSVIESGALNSLIYDAFNSDKNFKALDPLEDIKFKASIFNKTNTLVVSLDTANVKKGVKLLSLLNSKLVEKYSAIKKLYVKKIETEIQSIDQEIVHLEKAVQESNKDILIFINDNEFKLSNMENEIENIKTSKKTLELKKSRLENYVKKQKEEVKALKKNTDFLLLERNKLLTNGIGKDSSLSLMMSLNLIQQNLSLMDTMNNSLNKSYKNLSEVNFDLSGLDLDIKKLQGYIEKKKKNSLIAIEKMRNNSEKISAEVKTKVAEKEEKKAHLNIISNIQILQEPAPVKSPVGLNFPVFMLLVITGAFIIMSMAVLFVEYVRKNW